MPHNCEFFSFISRLRPCETVSASEEVSLSASLGAGFESGDAEA
jgi:hypothetical protein